MKPNIIYTTLIAAVAIGTASAGTYCPPAKGAKVPCAVDPCPPKGEIAAEYMTSYIFRGVRLLDDSLRFDVNYKFENFVLPIKIGVSHVTSLGSNNNIFGMGDQSNLYGEVGLPSLLGVDLALRYDHYFYPNGRPPGWQNQAGNIADSHGALSLAVARELFCGVTATYTRTYDSVWPDPYQVQDDNGAWLHIAELSKSFCLTDRASLELSGGAAYSDNLWGANATTQTNSATGWNHYFFEAALPIALNCNATLVPYLGYNGTPDGWMADGVQANPNGGFDANANDVFFGGVRISVGF